jgi:hypothetical protein
MSSNAARQRTTHDRFKSDAQLARHSGVALLEAS